MNDLVLCPCLHPAGNHDASGCHGDRRQRCPCALPPAEVLDAAIEEARSTYWRETAGHDQQREA